MNPDLEHALEALEGMLIQYCDSGTKTAEGRAIYSHLSMSAGEDACAFLLKHNRITEDQISN